MRHRELENAVVRLLKHRPFYGQLLLNCRRESFSGRHAVGITMRNGTPVISCNQERFERETPAAQEALLEHLLKHLLHLHMFRRKGRNSHDWDLACDLAVNPTITGLPPSSPFPVDLGFDDGLAAEEYYALLTAPFDCGALRGEGYGRLDREADGVPGGGDDNARRDALPTVDAHSVWDLADCTPARLAEEVVRGLVRGAWRASEGEAPADILPLVESLIAPAAIPWQRILDWFVAAAGRIGRRNSWQREHRRFGRDIPGNRKRRRLHLLVGVDVSDSTNTVELREEFARELVRLARGAEGVITVVYANSRVKRVETFRGSAICPEVYLGGGFTDLRPLFEYARTVHPRPSAVIYMTDGFGSAPERMEFPTLWVLTREGERPVPWGMELRLDR